MNTQNNNNENNAVVIQDVAPVSMLDTLKQTESVFFSTIPTGSREDAIKTYNAINGDGEQLADHFGEVIEVENIVAHPVFLENPDGKVVECLRIVLVTPDGESYASVSQGILSSVQKISGIVGPGPWAPAIKVVAKQVKTRKGFNTNTLTLV